MKRRKIAIILCLIVLITFASILIFKNDNDTLGQNHILETRLIEVCQSSTENSIIDFKEITNFKWDKMHIVTPYVDLKDYCEENKLKLDRNIDTQIKYNDSINLILFTLDNKIVSYINYQRQYGDFTMTGIDNKNGINSDKAKFRIMMGIDLKEIVLIE